MKASKRTIILIVAVALGLSAVVFARRYQRPPPPAATPTPGMTVGSDSITLSNDAPVWNALKVAPVAAAQPFWTDPIPAKILFDEAKTSRLGSPLAGRVTAVFVERGQRIKQGTQLFTVASPGLAELRAEISKTKLEAATAKVNYDRVKALVDAGSVPAKELVSAQQEVAEADLAVKLANEKLTSLKVSGSGEASFTVTAPREGVVVEKNVAVGQNADPSSGSLIAIADLTDVWVVADVFEADSASVKVGAKVKVTVNGTTELEGVVDQVSQVVDPERHTVPVRVKLSNPDGSLRPNAYAQIQFYDATPAKASLPASAVLSDGEHSYVYVKEQGTLRKRNITVARGGSGEMRVLEGLEPGEQVVVQGAILLDNQVQLEQG